MRIANNDLRETNIISSFISVLSTLDLGNMCSETLHICKTIA